VPAPEEDCVAEAEEVVDAACPEKASDDEVVAARIGANVALHRRAAGLTPRELGEAAEVDRSYLHHVENGERLPMLALIVKLAASLNVRCERVTSGITWEPSLGAFRVEATGNEADTALKRLGQNALHARRRVGVSQQILSARALMNRSDFVDFERGNRNFRVFVAVRLVGALGVDLAELFSGVADWYVRPLPAPRIRAGRSPSDQIRA